MNIFDRIRIKRKIRKMFYLMRNRMNNADVAESTMTIKTALCQLPMNRKEGLIDVCLKVLADGERL